MTAEQFDQHLAPLLDLRKGSGRSVGLRLVLVDGMSIYGAAQEAGVSDSSITAALNAAREAMEHVAGLSYPAVRLPPKRSRKTG